MILSGLGPFFIIAAIAFAMHWDYCRIPQGGMKHDD